jgi:hypothetical protein
MNRWGFAAAIFGLITISVFIPHPVVEGLVISTIVFLTIEHCT